MIKEIATEESAAISQLMNDKHNLLEGYVTEKLFYKEFVENNNIGSSSGWWMAKSKENETIFFIIKETLDENDLKIFLHINKIYTCYHVYQRNDDFYFSDLHQSISSGTMIIKHNLKMIRSSLNVKDSFKNEARQNKAIRFFKKHNILNEIALERYFANNFLTVYFPQMINIDLFTITKKGINAIEIKYKFEAKNGTFGVNQGQFEMFKLLNHIGINTYHFILYNHTKNKNLCIFDFLNSENQKSWNYCNTAKISSVSLYEAPEFTSLSGYKTQKYYQLPKNKFAERKVSIL